MMIDSDNYKFPYILKTIIKVIISFVILVAVGFIVFFTVDRLKTPVITTNNKLVTQKWIPDELKSRQILIKFKYSFLQQNILINRTNYFNGFLYEQNKILLPIDVLYSGEFVNNNIEEFIEYLKVDLFYTTVLESENKNVNDQSIWHSFDIIENPKLFNNIHNDKITVSNGNYIINEPVKYQPLILKTNIDNNIIKTKFRLDSFYRNDSEYVYWYSSLYIKDDIIHYNFAYDENGLLIKTRNDKIESNYQSIKYYCNKRSYNIMFKFLYSSTLYFDANFKIRNDGSINSFVIDPCGNIFAQQLAYTNNPSRAMFAYSR